MVYAGYVPAKIAKSEWSPLELALKEVTSEETLATLKKVTQNVAQQPTEPKFRKLKLTNEKIKTLIVDHPGALAALELLGWQRAEEEGAAVLLLPTATQMTMAHVRTIDAASERLAEAAKAAARAEAARRSRAANPEREAIRAQMEADRRERAARGPVTQASVAQPLGAGRMAGMGGPIGGGSGGGAHGHSSAGGVRCVHDAGAFRALLDEGRSANKAVIVDFTATWCGPCKMMAPVFEELAASTPGVIFAKVDVDEANDVAQQCGVSAMPTFQLFKNGAKVDEFRGADVAALRAMVAKA